MGHKLTACLIDQVTSGLGFWNIHFGRNSPKRRQTSVQLNNQLSHKVRISKQ